MIATRQPERPHLEANRIAGLAAAITLNLGLFMLLAVPMRAPPGSQPIEKEPVFRWILPREVPPPTPPTVPIAKSTPQPHGPQPRQAAQVAPPADSGVTVADTTMPIVGPPAGPTIDQTPTQSQPLPGMRLEYASAPAPDYPRDALREGVEGTVMLQVLVDVDGRPLQVDIQHSSGDRRLDIAARRQVLQHWRFRPAMKDGRAIQAIGLVPIAFDLQG